MYVYVHTVASYIRTYYHVFFKLLANPGQSPSVEPTPPKGGKSIKGTYVRMYVHNRDTTIWVIAILRIAFECIAIHCRIAIYD